MSARTMEKSYPGTVFSIDQIVRRNSEIQGTNVALITLGIHRTNDLETETTPLKVNGLHLKLHSFWALVQR